MTCQTVDKCSFELKNCCNQDDWECKALLVVSWPQLLSICAVLCYFTITYSTATSPPAHPNYGQDLLTIYFAQKILQVYRINFTAPQMLLQTSIDTLTKPHGWKFGSLEDDFPVHFRVMLRFQSLVFGGVIMCHLSQLRWGSQGKTSPE